MNMDNELTGFEEHVRDTLIEGDSRRCRFHPSVATSSPDGMFDAPCDVCEYEQDLAAAMWDYDPENPRRPFCGDIAQVDVPSNTMACHVDYDDIPF